jgi:LysR family transcriptional regulator, nitrogen assimilation regulatory protein
MPDFCPGESPVNAACLDVRGQTGVGSEGGIFALLGPYAVAAAPKERRLRSAKLVAPVGTRHIAFAMSRQAN